MSFYSDLEAAVLASAAFVQAQIPRAVMLFGKSSTGTPTPLEVGANGLKVDASAAGSATETTLAAVLAKLADPATQTTLAALLALAGSQRNSTAPNVTTTVQRLLEAARDGSLRVNADLYDHLHQTHLVVAGAFTRAPLTLPCDGVWLDNDGAVIYYQPRGRPWQIVDGNTFADASKWSGANWAVASAKATHTAGATTALTATIDATRPLVVGKRYAFVMTVTGRSAGSVTIYAGTQAGSARSADGTYLEVIVPATSGAVTVVPSNDFDGAISFLQVYGRSPKLPALSYVPLAAVEIVGVAAGSAMSTLLAASDLCEVHALYRRVPGVADLG